MSQNLGDVVTIQYYFAKNGFVSENTAGGVVIREFTSNDLIANQSMTFIGTMELVSTNGTQYPSYITFEAPNIYIESEIYIRNTANKNSITFNNSSVNFDDASYSTNTNYIGPIGFTGASSLNITSNTNGKTIIKASTITGTVSLDVEDGVQDGDTFSIEATDNQLVITDGDWTATPSTVGNVTTYTLATALQKPKFRLLYTIG